jgi:RNA polymerase sigma factor (sigma-70 family)
MKRVPAKPAMLERITALKALWGLKKLGRGENLAEDRLVNAAQNGSREAFDTLLRQHESRLRGFLVSRIGRDNLEDVLQETRVACWLNLPRYSGTSRFQAWLFGIAYHKCADHFRSRRGASSEVPLDEDAEQRPDPADVFDVADTRMIVRAFLKTLPETQREVMELYYYGGLTLVEIGTLLGRSPNTVKAQFYRAHSRAAEQLDYIRSDAAGANEVGTLLLKGIVTR